MGKSTVSMAIFNRKLLNYQSKLHHDPTVLPKPGIRVRIKGNHPQMSELFRVVNYYNLPIYIYIVYIYILYVYICPMCDVFFLHVTRMIDPEKPKHSSPSPG